MFRKLSTIIQQTYYNFNNPIRGINFEYDIQPQVNFSFDERGASTVQWFDEKVGSPNYFVFTEAEIQKESNTTRRLQSLSRIRGTYFDK